MQPIAINKFPIIVIYDYLNFLQDYFKKNKPEKVFTFKRETNQNG